MFISENFDSQQAIADDPITGYQSTVTQVDRETLVQMVKSKSERGFNILYDNYCGALYGILIRFVLRRDVADDLLQDVFLKIWKNIDCFDPQKGTLFTWMLNITRNQAIDYLRSSCHRRQMLHVNNDLFSLHKDYFGSVDANNRLLEIKDIKGKVRQLDPKYAEVIDLIFFYGCTQEQTARIMKLPLGTVKTRARKALGILKILYQQ
jgi:RNA polymerase sigma-70 factor, ECF subfamily